MAKCKKCGSEVYVKNGFVGGRQRYKCKSCGCNFREGDGRTNDKVAVKKALCVLLYAMGKASFRFLGKLLNTDHALIYRWIREFGESLPEPEIDSEIKEMQFDEMWHF
jgi:transposase-like protein